MKKLSGTIVFFLLVTSTSCYDDSFQSVKEDKMKRPDERKVEKQIEIGAPVAKVWKALTDAEELRRWFPLDATVEPGVGGEIQISWGEKFTWQLRIEVWATEEHLRLTYDTETDYTPEGKAEQKSAGPAEIESRKLVVDYHLKARGGSTVLRLVHSGFGPDSTWDNEYDSVRRGWNHELNSLKHYLEKHEGEERMVAWARVPCQPPYEDVWGKLFSAGLLTLAGSLKDLQVGKPYEITSPDTDVFRGVITDFNPPYDFVGSVENHNWGILRIWIEKFGQRSEANLWFSGYGVPAAEVQALEQRWSALLQRLLVVRS